MNSWHDIGHADALTTTDMRFHEARNYMDRRIVRDHKIRSNVTARGEYIRGFIAGRSDLGGD